MHSAVKVFGMYYEYGTTITGKNGDSGNKSAIEPKVHEINPVIVMFAVILSQSNILVNFN